MRELLGDGYEEIGELVIGDELRVGNLLCY